MKTEAALFYKDVQSPVGQIRLIASNDGLVAVLWEGEGYHRTKLATPQADNQHPILLQTEQQLEAYFRLERNTFNIPLDLRGTDFQLKVWKALLDIPYGRTRTYGELARLLGDIKAVRAVGGALNKNPVSIVVPCRRIIGGSGKLVGFAGGLTNKSVLLDLETSRTVPRLF